MDPFNITVTIAERPYRLVIDRMDEEIVRKAAKSINETIKEYAGSYAFKDKQDLLAMVSLQYATETLRLHKNGQAETAILERLSNIEKVIDENL